MQGFALNTFNSAGAGNLANREGGTKATLACSEHRGRSGAGSLKIDAPFNDYNQFVDLQKGYGATTLKNWTRLQAARPGEGRIGRQPERR